MEKPRLPGKHWYADYIIFCFTIYISLLLLQEGFFIEQNE
jgi:hypothetical protein